MAGGGLRTRPRVGVRTRWGAGEIRAKILDGMENKNKGNVVAERVSKLRAGGRFFAPTASNIPAPYHSSYRYDFDD